MYPLPRQGHFYGNYFSWASTESQHIVTAILRNNLEKSNLASSVGDIHKEKQFVRVSHLDVRGSSRPLLSAFSSMFEHMN